MVWLHCLATGSRVEVKALPCRGAEDKQVISTVENVSVRPDVELREIAKKMQTVVGVDFGFARKTISEWVYIIT